MYSQDPTTSSTLDGGVVIRPPVLTDGAQIFQLVRECGVLDRNSCYAYLLLCRDFSSTCLVATLADDLVGFLTAYVPPERPDVIFVWQIGVSPAARQRGIGKSLLGNLLDSLPGSVRHLEATVTAGNSASLRLFQSLAAQRGGQFTVSPGFSAEDFGGLDGGATPPHEPEDTIQIILPEPT